MAALDQQPLLSGAVVDAELGRGSHAIEAIKTKAIGKKSGFGLTFIRRFVRVFRIGFPVMCVGRGCCNRNTLLAWAVWIGSVVLGVATFGLSLIGAAFITNIVGLHTGTVLLIFGIGTFVFIGYGVLSVTVRYTGSKVAILWRKRLVDHVHERYYASKLAFWLTNVDARVDNVDQRIAQDLNVLAQQATTLVFGSLTGTTSLGATFVTLLTSLVFIAGRISWIPMVVSFAFFALSLFITTLLLAPVAKATYRVNEAEGDFRFLHARVKEFSETITMYGGQEREHAIATSAFDTMYKRFQKLFLWTFFMSTWSTFQRIVPGIIGAASVAFLISSQGGTLEGKTPTVKLVQETVAAVSSLLGALAAVPSIYTQLGTLAGLTHRVGQMLEAIDELEAIKAKVDASVQHVKQGDTVKAHGIVCHTPDGKQLFSNLTFEVKPGRGLIIMGPSGSGKSSLLRCLAGLWPVDMGEISRPLDVAKGCFFLPQRSFITEGTLRDQILYPDTAITQKCDDHDLERLLEQLGLAFLLSRPGGLDAVESWDSMLSIGEQQRLAFARLLYHKPKYALMDEATSALDVDMQKRVMGLVMQAGITPISVAHRPSLVLFHQDMLRLDGAGGYHFGPVDEADVLNARTAATRESRSLTVVSTASKESKGVPASRGPTGTASVLSATSNNRQSFGVQSPSGTVREVAGGFLLTDDHGDPKEMQFNRAFWRRLVKLVALGFPSCASKTVFVALLTTVMVAITSYLEINLQYLAGPIYNDITDEAFSAAYGRIIIAALIIFAFSATNAGSAWLGKLLSLYWYQAMVRKAQETYFHKRTLFGANHLAPALDNMDQRIAADCRSLASTLGGLLFGGGFTTSTVSVVQTIFTCGYGLYAASAVGYMPVLVITAYSIVMAVVTYHLSRPIVPTTYTQNVKEGDFRRAHVRMREFSESIAFYSGQKKEREFADVKFKDAYDWALTLIWKTVPATMWALVSARVGFLLGYAAVAYIALSTKSLGGGAVNQDSVVTYVGLLAVYAEQINLFASYITAVASVAGYAHRVGHMLDSVERISGLYDTIAQTGRLRDSPVVKLEGVHCRTPTGEVLFRDLGFEVHEGQNLLIMGPSGSGKSSLLRVISGAWPISAGYVGRPEATGRGGVFFVPQRPYMMQGSLRDQLLYPHTTASRYDDGNDGELVRLLQEVDLGHLLACKGGLDAEEVWQDMLSVGEQQRVGFIRLLYHRPKYALLDESSSALDVALEARCYGMCSAAGITCISVGHRVTLVPFHERVLLLDGSGGFAERKLGHSAVE